MSEFQNEIANEVNQIFLDIQKSPVLKHPIHVNFYVFELRLISLLSYLYNLQGVRFII